MSLDIVAQNPTTGVDASAVAQLDTDAQRAPVPAARIAREGGPTWIDFKSRDDFTAWCDYGLIRVGNPWHIVVGGKEVHVPVTFGFPHSWNAVAVYPAQTACDCDAEIVHQVGCSAYVAILARTEHGRHVLAEHVDLQAAPECPGCGVLNGSHQPHCYAVHTDADDWHAPCMVVAGCPTPQVDDAVRGGCEHHDGAHFGNVVTVDPDLTGDADAAITHLLDAAAQIPVLVLEVPGAYDSASVQDAIHAAIAQDIVHYRTPDQWTACGYDPRGTDTRHAERVTCPDCLATLPAVLPQRIPGALLGDVPTLAEVRNA